MGRRRRGGGHCGCAERIRLVVRLVYCEALSVFVAQTRGFPSNADGFARPSFHGPCHGSDDVRGGPGLDDLPESRQQAGRNLYRRPRRRPPHDGGFDAAFVQRCRGKLRLCRAKLGRGQGGAGSGGVEAGRRLGTHLGFLCLRNGLAVRQGTDRVCSGRFRRGRLGPRRPLPAVAFDVFSGFGGFALPAHSHAGGGSKNGPCALQLY